jgi:hypothetical protein
VCQEADEWSIGRHEEIVVESKLADGKSPLLYLRTSCVGNYIHRGGFVE